jgi:hypothetical protein
MNPVFLALYLRGGMQISVQTFANKTITLKVYHEIRVL